MQIENVNVNGSMTPHGRNNSRRWSVPIPGAILRFVQVFLDVEDAN